MAEKRPVKAPSALMQQLGRTPLAYKMKTTIHANGKLGVEDPGERAKAGFLQMAAAVEDAKALHEILPYAISLFEELEACRALYAGVERMRDDLWEYLGDEVANKVCREARLRRDGK